MDILTYYTPKYFKSYEVVPKEIYDKFGDLSFQFLDPRVLLMADNLRDIFGPVIINNWKEGGTLNSCGLRLADDDVGAKYSPHKYGKALDLHFGKITAEEVRDWISKNQDDERIKYISRIEKDTLSWFHFDIFNVPRIQWISFYK